MQGAGADERFDAVCELEQRRIVTLLCGKQSQDQVVR